MVAPRTPTPLELKLTLNDNIFNVLKKMDIKSINSEKTQIEKLIFQPKEGKKCWYCDRFINLAQPIIVPIRCNTPYVMSEADKIKYQRKLNRDNIFGIYEGEGQFDTFPCARNYIENKLKLGCHEYNKSLSLLHDIYRTFTDKFDSMIPRAPDKHLQHYYSTSEGLSPEDYDKLFGEYSSHETQNYIPEDMMMIPRQKRIDKSRI